MVNTFLPRILLLVLAIALPVAAQARERPPAACGDDAPVVQMLDGILRAYERGDVHYLQARLAPDLPGLGFVLNDVAAQHHQQQQVRIHITERQLQCGPDVAVIDFAWEKRWVEAGSFTPRHTQGRSSILFSGLREGLGGNWRISGLAGDSVVASGGGATRP